MEKNRRIATFRFTLFILYPLSFILFLAFPAPMRCNAEGPEELIHVRGIVHINTNVSSGVYPPEYEAEKASGKDIGVVFFTENLRPRWEYGLYPLRNIIKKTVERDGLLAYGPERYAVRAASAGKKYGITCIMSAEAAPFYYWTGDPFRAGLTLHDWDAQLIVTGLSPGAYRGIPTIANGGGKRYGAGSLPALWPLALLAAGIFLLKRKFSRLYVSDPLCWAMITAGALFLVNNFPFKEVRYDQYGGPAGAAPYQAVIDYVSSRGGMTFWSAPEAVTDTVAGPVKFVSRSSEKYMLETHGYTGFCCFYEGYRKVGGPGGVWDRVLSEYCSGKRASPAWAIGEVAYHGSEGSGRKEIDEVETVFLSPSPGEGAVLAALRSGRMYAVRNSKECRLRLEDLTVEYPGGGKAMMGEELVSPGPVKVNFAVTWEGPSQGPVTAEVIRAGKVVKEYALTTPGAIEFADDFYEPGTKVYYRLDIRGGYPAMLFSNPIFVKFLNRREKMEGRR